MLVGLVRKLFLAGASLAFILRISASIAFFSAAEAFQPQTRCRNEMTPIRPRNSLLPPPPVILLASSKGIYFVALGELTDAFSSLKRRRVDVSEASLGTDAAPALKASPAATAQRKGGGPSVPARPSLSSFEAFFAGAGARALAAAVMSPVAVVKTRAEFTPLRPPPAAPTPLSAAYRRSTAHAVATIARVEGVGALYAGLLPTILRDCPFSGIYYAVYEALRSALRTERAGAGAGASPLVNFCSGFVAAAVATLVTQPADVVRTQLQLPQLRAATAPTAPPASALPGALHQGVGAVAAQQVPAAPSSFAATLRSVFARDGVRGFFVGGTARLLKRTLSTATTWTLFEEAMRRFRLGKEQGGTQREQ